MIDVSAIGNRTLIGRTLRAPLKLIPKDLVMPVVQGPLRGAKWIVGSATHGCWLGCYEMEKQKACLRYLHAGLTAYDIGANAGFYTILLSRLVGDRGTVHAFEPFDRNVRYLRRHVAMNSASNVRIHPVAVGRGGGTLAFDPASSPSMGRVVSDPVGTTVTVPVVCLDDFVYLEGQSPPDFVKMDIEGGEGDALAGMCRVLTEKRPVLFIALHGSDQASRCRRTLGEASYSIRDFTGRPVASGPEPNEIIAVPEGQRDSSK